ncbi:MAG: T9SS type A sorting domain-containing protein [Bacteroidetes bacterium]|nr:T9SS type A sorting domain-containing protein [Bacteroidota bacterium]
MKIQNLIILILASVTTTAYGQDCCQINENDTTVCLGSTVSYSVSAKTNNYSVEFDGTNYINCDSSVNLKGTGDMTIMAWINPSSSTTNWIVNKGSFSTAGYGVYNLWLENGIPKATIRFSPSSPFYIHLTGSSAIPFNAWTHFALVADSVAGEIRFYVNGVLEHDTVWNGIYYGNITSDLLIGCYYKSDGGGYIRYFDGRIDEVSVWGRALSAEDILETMNCGLNVSQQTDLIGFWDLDDGSGTTTVDQTSNGNDGTLISGPTWSTDVPFGSGFTYIWSTGDTTSSVSVSPDSTVNIHVTTTDAQSNTCSDTVMVSAVQVDTSVTVIGNVLSSNASVAAYQWLDCSTGHSPIPGETTATYTAPESGSYGVEVTQNGCVDTSACFEITVIGLPNDDLGSLISIYPNPTQGVVFINLGKLIHKVVVTIWNTMGQVVFSQTYSEARRLSIPMEQVEGLYIIEVATSESGSAQRVLLSLTK